MDSRRVSWTEVPAEIWLRVWHSTSNRDLQSLVLVCRYFRDLCQPLLFKHQRFQGPRGSDCFIKWIPTTLHLHNEHNRLRKLAASKHALAVRAWDFHATSGLSDLPLTHPRILNIRLIPETYAKVLQIFCSTLGDYQNLRSLSVSAFVIDSPFRATLSSLRLEELTMAGCEILARTGPLLALRRVSLTALHGHSPSTPADDEDPNQPIHIASPETLRTLTIDGSRDACALFPTLHFNNIVNLHIKLSEVARDRSLALAFLQDCPHVAHIEISRPSTLVGTLPRSLPPTAIPNLRSFKGPTSLGGLITAERPVSVVEISGSVYRKEDIIKGLSAIAHTSVALHSLTLDIPMEALVAISATIGIYFPELRELSLGLLPPGLVRASAYEVTHYRVPMDDPADDDYRFEFNSADLRAYTASSPVDDRTVDLPDNDDVVPITGFRRRIHRRAEAVHERIPDAGTAVPIPDVLVPGHMYTLSGRSFPPGPDPTQSDASDSEVSPPETLPASFPGLDEAQELLESICTARVPFPTSLGALRLKGVVGDDRPTLHRIVLALEQQLPAVRELSFAREGENYNVWTRIDDTWTQRGSGVMIASLVRRGQ
ncbi:hypothetical protein DFH09DRAFT_1276276 [Mycena vulgaris]|nr:hypothetical protein DFH09DRAFT_1276276 [Mycena vulgaris]